MEMKIDEKEIVNKTDADIERYLQSTCVERVMRQFFHISYKPTLDELMDLTKWLNWIPSTNNKIMFKSAYELEIKYNEDGTKTATIRSDHYCVDELNDAIKHGDRILVKQPDDDGDELDYQIRTLPQFNTQYQYAEPLVATKPIRTKKCKDQT